MLDARVVKARRRFVVDATVRVATGEACGLFGTSGSGKSTILGCIAGVETPDDGYVRFDSVALHPPPVPLHRRPIGYLTQDANLFPHLDVGRNVRFGSAGASEDGAWIGELRERLDLGALWTTSAAAISGGQARRVALARMLARKPRLVLLDEPFAGLDRRLVRDLVAALAAWQRSIGFTMLVVDHDPDVLSRLCARAVVVEDGTVVQDASWNVLRSAPETRALAELLERF